MNPLSQYVLKVHSRCDLACDHCYVYQHADQGWRRQPPAMAPATVHAGAVRIAEHAAAHDLRRVRVVLHGGEPLLLGPDRLDATIAELRRVIEPVVRLDLRMQTNGVRLTPEICEILLAHGVRVGISIDGDQAANDRHRRFATGGSSHADVVRAIALLSTGRYRPLYAGLLCTVDVRNDPDAVYDALVAHAPPRIDFLLPHATWDQPPPGQGHYAAWLGRIFDRWHADRRRVRIRLFDALTATGAGGASDSEWVGLSPADLVVVETDGTWERADTLKTAFDGATATGLSVFSHPVDAVARLPDVAGRQRGLDGLSAICRSCPVVRQCGGGLYAHRYRSANGFDNPSVYCADLRELIDHMNDHRPVAPPPSQSGPSRRPLAEEAFAQLADGYGGAAAVAALARADVAITRGLAAAVADRAGGRAAEGLAVLAEVERSAPAAVAEVLAHPYVQRWAALCLRPAGTGRPADPAYLCHVAAAAAVRAGAERRIPIPVPPAGGPVHLPTLGTVETPPAGDGVATLAVEAGRLSIDGRWHEAHRAAGLVIEDLDPYRDCHDWPAAPRLPAAQVRHWQVAVDEALAIVARDAPAYEAGLRAGLRCLTPLRPDPAGRDRSSTARHAFGAVAAALSSPAQLAVLLVHEFQHSKLNLLLRLYRLVDRSRPVLLTVGWRTDPRPVEAALHGAYAHLAVADIWRVRAGAGDPAAADRYRTYRDWTRDALAGLAGSGALTPDGTGLVDRLSATVAGWDG